jgi:Sensors of blue-light using FAD
MFFLIFASSATHLMTRSELLDLLAKARSNNTRLALTGMLLYKDGNFLQVLEGEEAVVRASYAKISCDLRHKDAKILLQGTLAERQFPDWSMGFYDLDAVDLRTVPGYSEFMNTPLTSTIFGEKPSRAQLLLSIFKRNIR